MKIYAKAKDGYLTFDQFSRLRLKEYLTRHADKTLQVEIKLPFKSRSLNQNAYYWAVIVQGIADFTGEDPQDIHNYLKAQYLQEVGPFIIRIKSTSELSTVESEAYYEKCRAWAMATLGIFIPLPNEKIE